MCDTGTLRTITTCPSHLDECEEGNRSSREPIEVRDPLGVTGRRGLRMISGSGGRSMMPRITWARQ